MSSTLQLNLLKLSIELDLKFQVVSSWWQHLNFANYLEAKNFFIQNKAIIKATPFVKWVWWKRQILPFLEKYFPDEFNDYFEPFLGGWAVFFNLQKKQSFLSDINEELINTYKIVKNKPKELIEFLKTCKYDEKFFYKIRTWDREKNWQKKYSKIERAGRFIFLNRTCFNWLYRVNSKWEFNVPFGSYKNPDFVQEENILNTSKLLNKVKAEIQVLDFQNIVSKVKSGDFVYFDPPYDTISNTANFTNYNENGFWKEMQKKLRDVFVELDEKWAKVMLSNHNTEFVRELYKDYKIEMINAKRNVNSKGDKRGSVEEVVVMNY